MVIKKLKMQELNSPEVLTRQQLMNVLGGIKVITTVCSKNSDCGSGEKCSGLPGLPKVCGKVSVGAGCTGDDDCGNGQTCAANGTGGTPAKWCVPYLV